MKRPALFFLAIFYPTLCFAMPTSEFVSRWKAVIPNAQHLRPEEFANQPEVKALNAEFGKAFDQYKAAILKARADNAVPRSCPPKDANLQLNDILAAAEKLPADWQSREFTDSFGKIMDDRYPCPKDAKS
ncbi:hypothetical protein PX554_18650 [Sphingomonas sp. H39-1-10]|uniref:hypothetical protein n=1 Tax=Sphingomonas pollutisoli TaxID=3030829 RepID=UPI0023B9EEB7|nr:hypothetical protein [Sphingomonas pollutisoli]MDF0490150.1 hypothetical protein [Sphingomonas pollutisoli]